MSLETSSRPGPTGSTHRAGFPDLAERPPLMGDTAFWGITATQFLGAFNDNFFKQLMLLLAIHPGYEGEAAQDQQWLATMVFSMPFVIGSGYAGYLSDRFSKRRVMVLSKVAEIVVMALGLIGFLFYPWTGYTGLVLVLFLMGLQSTFFGPGKYGILPELFRPSDLPRANGIILMTTFLAIIFGTAIAGGLTTYVGAGQLRPDQVAASLWVGSAACIAIAVVGTLTSLAIRRVPAAMPGLQVSDWSSLLVPRETRTLLRIDRPLMGALLASCMFWLVSGIAIQAVNALGKVQLHLLDVYTSIMTASIGLGICVGAVLAGRLSRGCADARLVKVGAWGIVLVLCLLAISTPDRSEPTGFRHLLGFAGSVPALIAVGIFAAMFAIPLQVFLQDRPPAAQKGRMIATMNVYNFFAIVLSGVFYLAAHLVQERFAWPTSSIFAMMALLMLVVAVGYRPRFDAPPVSAAALDA